jgi:hypothetical protein
MLQYSQYLTVVIAWTSWLLTAMPYRGVIKALEFSMIGGAQGTIEPNKLDLVRLTE